LDAAAAKLLNETNENNEYREGRTVLQDDCMRNAKFQIGQIVRHRLFPFRGVIFDVDAVFSNTEEWLMSIPEELRPRRDQPFYHLLAQNAETSYIAYVSEQNLLPDESGKPVSHPRVGELFEGLRNGRYVTRQRVTN
jgi:heat shock protein HspQ